MNPAQKIIEKFGGQSALAEIIGKRQSTISYWAKTGKIPKSWQRPLMNLAVERGIKLSKDEFLPPSLVVNAPIVVDEIDDELKGMQSPFAKWRGVIDLGGEGIDCYVLDTGQRVIALRATVKAIANADSGNLGGIIGVSSLNSFINKDLILGELIEFSIPGTQMKGQGLKTEHFEMILSGYVQALFCNAPLTDRQREIALKCAILTTGLTRTGLDALVDEATGYQYERAENALQVKLRAFIAEELRAWEKTFPDELWEEFGRLTNWTTPLRHRPRWWGKLVIELIYDTLDPDVAEYLRNNRPPSGAHWHRQLTENIGVRNLVSRCYEIIGMAKTCKTISELKQKVAEHYGKRRVQLTLYIDN